MIDEASIKEIYNN